MGDLDARLGQWMAVQREVRGLSQEALAIQLGRDQPVISKIERGLRRVSVEYLLRWAEAVGVSSDDLCRELDSLREEFAPSQSLGREDDWGVEPAAGGPVDPDLPEPDVSRRR